MPAERVPARPVKSGRTPDGFTPYKVTDGDSWETLASRHEIPAWELIYENFRTRDPAETNWYLRNHVGCTRTTQDGANYIFSADARPGTICVPAKRVEPAANKNAERKAPALSNVWAGVAKAHSGDLFVVGAHDLTGMVYNLGDSAPDMRNAVLNINGFKFGPGLGGSIGAVFVLAHGYSSAQDMNGVAGDWDFDLSIGAKLADILKGIRGIGTAVDTLQKYKKMRYVAENAIKNRNLAQRGVYTLPIPLAGVGLHAWAGFKFGDVSVLRTGRGLA